LEPDAYEKRAAELKRMVRKASRKGLHPYRPENFGVDKNGAGSGSSRSHRLKVKVRVPQASGSNPQCLAKEEGACQNRDLAIELE